MSQSRTAKVSELTHKPALIGFLNESTLQSPVLVRTCYIEFTLADVGQDRELDCYAEVRQGAQQ